MLFLATLGAVTAFFAWGRTRWEGLAKISDATFIGAAFCGTAFLILSGITGFLAWPWDRLWRTPTVYSKVTYATLALNLWVILIVARLRYGGGIWVRKSLSVPLLICSLLALLTTVMAASAGGHLGHGASLLDPLFTGFNPYIPLVLPPWASLGVMAAGIFSLCLCWQFRVEKPMTKWAYVAMAILFLTSAGITKLLSLLQPTGEIRPGEQSSQKQMGFSMLHPAEGASIKIISPNEGKVVRGDQVSIHFKLVKGKRGEHVHAYVDGELMGMFKSEKGTLTGVQPGHHVLELRVVAEDHHTEIDATDRIHFVVK
jgi:hypothetical protein